MAAGLDVGAGALGIVSVAQQLMASIWKIKTFCKDVKNAPEELLDTISTIDNFGKILMRLGEAQTRDLNDMRNGDILRESMSLSKRAVDCIASLAMELQLEMQCSKRGRVKTVLKQSTIEAMMRKIDRSKIDLQFAYTLFTDARRRQEFDVIKQYVSERREDRLYSFGATATTVRYQDVAGTEGMCLTRKQRTMGPKRDTYSVDEWSHNTRIQFPLWLCRYAWDVAVAHACGQWIFSLKSFKIIDWSNPVREMVEEDDAYGLRELFERRELSIHDEFSNGISLLEVSSYIDWSRNMSLHK